MDLQVEADLHPSEGKTKHDAAKRKDSLNSSFEIVEIDSSDDEVYKVCGLKKSFADSSSGPRPTQDMISSKVLFFFFFFFFFFFAMNQNFNNSSKSL